MCLLRFSRLLLQLFVAFVLCYSSSVYSQMYNGKWEFTEVISAPECNQATFQDSYVATVSQLGEQMTVTIGSIVRSGRITGSQLSFTSNYQEDGGTTSSTGIINFSDATASGTASFTFTRGNTVCGGSTVFDGKLVVGDIEATPKASPPGTPIVAAGVNTTNLTVNWSSLPSATGYMLYYAPFPDASPVSSLNVGNQLSMSAELPAGSAFYIAVRAYNEKGEGSFSNVINFTIPAP